MKLIIYTMLSIFSTQAMAWKPIISCNSEELVIDQGYDHQMRRPKYQWVLRGEPLAYLIQEDAISEMRVNEKEEFVSTLFQYDSAFMDFSGVRPGIQIKYMIYLNRRDRSVSLLANMENRIGGRSREMANWIFNDCWFR